MMTDKEIREYLRIPEHKRDRKAFRRDQIAEARRIIENLHCEDEQQTA